MEAILPCVEVVRVLESSIDVVSADLDRPQGTSASSCQGGLEVKGDVRAA